MVGQVFTRASFREGGFSRGQAGFSGGQAPPDAVHLDHGGGDEVNDGGNEADGQPGIEEEEGNGQAH